MPVVTTGPRSVTASTHRPLANGLMTFPAAGQILFGRNPRLFHTLGMWSYLLPALQYGMAIAEADRASSRISGRPHAAALSARTTTVS
jgi:hypothetical protein